MFNLFINIIYFLFYIQVSNIFCCSFCFTYLYVLYTFLLFYHSFYLLFIINPLLFLIILVFLDFLLFQILFYFGCGLSCVGISMISMIFIALILVVVIAWLEWLKVLELVVGRGYVAYSKKIVKIF